MDRLTAKLVNRLTAMFVNRLTAMLVNRLTAKLMNRLTAKLVVVNLVKLHLTKFIQKYPLPTFVVNSTYMYVNMHVHTFYAFRDKQPLN